MSTSSGEGTANDARVSHEEQPAFEEGLPEEVARRLTLAADWLGLAVVAAHAKVEKQRRHLAEAQAAVKAAQVEYDKARKAVDRARDTEG